MNLNLDIKDFKEQIHGVLGKLSKSPSPTSSNKKPSQILKPLINQLAKYSFDNETMLGVDITPHYVRVCQMKHSYGQWLLNNLASACMENQFRKYDINANIDLYAQNLIELISKNKITEKNVAFTVPTSSSVVKVLNFPDMSDDDFAQAAALGSIWESAIMLDGGIGEYFVSYKILSHNPPKEMPQVEAAPLAITNQMETIAVETPVEAAVETPQTIEELPAEGMAIESTVDATMPSEAYLEAPVEMPVEQPMNYGPTMDVLFVATKLADIYLYSEIISKAGLNPVLADIRCLALKYAFQNNPENLKSVSEPYAFIEFGPDENYVFIIDNKNTDIHNVYVSEEDKNIVIYSSEDIVQMQTFAQNFASQVQQIINEHEARSGSRINNIFVTSSAPLHVNDASSAPLVKTFVENISAMLTGYQIAECNFCGHVVVPEKFAKQVNAEGNLSAWAPSIGIASRKLDIFGYENDVKPLDCINLLPNGESIKKTLRASMLSTVALAAMLALTIITTCYSYLALKNTNHNLAQNIKEMDGVEKAYNEKDSEAQRLTVVMNQVTSLDGIQKSLPSNQGSVISAYNQITQVIPEGIWLSEISYNLPDKISITGNASDDESILAFVSLLNQGDVFEKMDLKTMQTKEEAEAKDSKDKSNALHSEGVIIKNFVLEGKIKKVATNKAVEILSKEAKNGN